jgi:hypothetical protein
MVGRRRESRLMVRCIAFHTLLNIIAPGEFKTLHGAEMAAVSLIADMA